MKHTFLLTILSVFALANSGSAATISYSGTFATNFGTPPVSAAGTTINVDIEYDSSLTPTVSGNQSTADGVQMSFEIVDSGNNVLRSGVADNAMVGLDTGTQTLLFRQIGGISSPTSDIRAFAVGFRANSSAGWFSSAEIGSLSLVETLLTTRLSTAQSSASSFGVDDNSEVAFISGSDGFSFDTNFSSLAFDPTNDASSPVPLPAAGWLLLAGLMGAVVLRRSKA